jgi:glycosyltransferase involved in cell wall biosynthesis
MVEGHYFGCPLISSDYPGMRELAERFRLPVSYFPVDDAAALGQRLADSLEMLRLTGERLAAVRANLRSYEYSFECHAERLYDVLVELGKAGRKTRSGAA